MRAFISIDQYGVDALFAYLKKMEKFLLIIMPVNEQYEDFVSARKIGR